MLVTLYSDTFIADTFKKEAVFTERFVNDAFVDTIRELLTFVRDALHDDTLVTDALFTETFVNDAVILEK